MTNQNATSANANNEGNQMSNDELSRRAIEALETAVDQSGYSNSAALAVEALRFVLGEIRQHQQTAAHVTELGHLTEYASKIFRPDWAFVDDFVRDGVPEIDGRLLDMIDEHAVVECLKRGVPFDHTGRYPIDILNLVYESVRPLVSRHHMLAAMADGHAFEPLPDGHHANLVSRI